MVLHLEPAVGFALLARATAPGGRCHRLERRRHGNRVCGRRGAPARRIERWPSCRPPSMR